MMSHRFRSFAVAMIAVLAVVGGCASQDVDPAGTPSATPTATPSPTPTPTPTATPTPRVAAASVAKVTTKATVKAKGSGWDKNGNGVCDRGEELDPAPADGKWSDASRHGCQYDPDLQAILDQEDAKLRQSDDDGDGIPTVDDSTPHGAPADKSPATTGSTGSLSCPAGTSYSPRRERCVTYCEEFPNDSSC